MTAPSGGAITRSGVPGERSVWRGLVVCDLDGTLLNSGGEVTSRTRAALRHMQELGWCLVFATGRPVRDVRPVVEMIGPNAAAVCSNGAITYDFAAEEVVDHRPMAPDVVRRLVTVLRATHPAGRLGAERDLELVLERGFRLDEARCGSAQWVADLGAALDDRGFLKVVWQPDGDVAARCRALRVTLPAGYEVTMSTSAFCEISAAGVTKATALQRLADHLGVAAPDTIAFGDMPNDIPMLVWAGSGVAVANAPPEVIAASDEVTESNDRDGVARYLERLWKKAGTSGTYQGEDPVPEREEEVTMSIPQLKLAGDVPTVPLERLESGMQAAAGAVQEQLLGWGFMAVEVVGIGARVRSMMDSFATACASTDPRLSDYAYSSVPQISDGGTHGFFPYLSEVPRLANGVPDPKEFIHVSGAMLRNHPPDAGAVLRAFPEFGALAAEVFDNAFRLISLFGQIIRDLMPEGTPGLELSRDATNLRVIHYRDTRGRDVLAHEHSGIQMLGLQLPPTDQGLQYVLHDGTWVEPVIANTDIVLCNIGRMLSSASNGQFRPSTHRVHCSNPSEGYQRLSSVLFAYPPHNARQWRMSDGLVQLDTTWGDFIADRFRGLGSPATSR